MKSTTEDQASGPWFKFYASDFLCSSAASELSTRQLGAYVLLLSYQWIHGDLPSREPELARLCRMRTRTFQKDWSDGLSVRFQAEGDRLFNPRLRLEQEGLARRRNQTAKARAAKGNQR